MQLLHKPRRAGRWAPLVAVVLGSAVFAGPAQAAKPAGGAGCVCVPAIIVTYNTADNQYTASWNDLAQKMSDAGAKLVPNGRIDYPLNFNTIQADAQPCSSLPHNPRLPPFACWWWVRSASTVKG